MAGDWIKLEKCSPDKPEVMRLARLWGVPKDQAFGSIVRFWIWLDNASVDGVVDGVGSHEVDDMMRVAGFAKGLESVKWLDIDDAIPRIKVPNFGKHNSESAKKRALTNERQAKWRGNVGDVVDVHVDADSVTKTSTREEKNREDKKDQKQEQSVAIAPPPKVKAAVSVHGTRLDPLWVLPADWAQWALIERSDWTLAEVERVALVFRDHWHTTPGKDARKLDWFKTWCNWVRKERRDYRHRTDKLDRKTETIDNLTGKHRGRTVNGSAERMGGATVLSLPSSVREPSDDDVEGRGPGGGEGAVG